MQNSGETTSLTSADVARLMREPSADARAQTVTKVALAFDPGRLGDKEQAIARDIFMIIARDAEVLVRAALSQALKTNPDVPREVALRLAHDVAAVAVPFIEVSKVLSESDLLEIIASTSAEHQTAVAKRPDVTERVAESLVERGDERAVGTLMANELAKISERTFGAALDRFGSNPAVNEPMARRKSLPIMVTSRLVTLVSDKLRDHLVSHHELPDDLAADLLLQSRERALVSLLTDADEVVDLPQLVADLREHGRLTPTLILRILCTGNLDFFEEALAQLSGITVVNARRLIHDPGPLGLVSLYERCRLPPELFSMVQAAVETIDDTQYDGGPADRARFVERVIERVLTRGEDPGAGEDIDWLIARLSRAIATRGEQQGVAALH